MRAKKLAVALSAFALAGALATPASAATSSAPVAKEASASSEIGTMTVKGCAFVGAHPTIKQGSTNTRAVKHAQCLLNKVQGMKHVTIDGSFGAVTRVSVRQMQQKCYPKNPAEHDGIIGGKTWSCLHYKR